MDVLDSVVTELRSVPGVISVWYLDTTERSKIRELEDKTGATPGFAGLVVVNDGVKVVLDREFVVCINHSSDLRHPPKSILILTAGMDAANVVGEEIWNEDQYDQFQNDPNVVIIGKSFVLHRDKLEAARGMSLRFVLEAQGFPEIERIEGVRDVVSSTLSPITDIYIKRRAGWSADELDRGTVLIGFNTLQSKV